MAEQFDSFVDRDMMMRYYFGLGIGHTYSHSPRHSSSQEPQCSAGGSAAQGLDASSHDDADDMIQDDASLEVIALCLDEGDGAETEAESSDSDDDNLEDEHEDNATLGESDSSESDDEEKLLHMDMYG